MSESLRVETVATLAVRLGLTRDAVVREVVAGRMPYVNVGGHWRFRESDIAYWTKNHGAGARLRVVEQRQVESG